MQQSRAADGSERPKSKGLNRPSPADPSKPRGLETYLRTGRLPRKKNARKRLGRHILNNSISIKEAIKNYDKQSAKNAKRESAK